MDEKKEKELIETAEAIKACIADLKRGRLALPTRADQKADTIGEYRKELAKVLLRMKVGDEIEFEGKIIKNPPVSIMLNLAHGVCWKEKLAMELADAKYKNAIEGMKALKAELNGWQSINRHLSEV